MYYIFLEMTRLEMGIYSSLICNTLLQDKTQSTVMPSLKFKQLHVSSVAVSQPPYPVVCRLHPLLEPPLTVHVVQSTSSVKRSLQGVWVVVMDMYECKCMCVHVHVCTLVYKCM